MTVFAVADLFWLVCILGPYALVVTWLLVKAIQAIRRAARGHGPMLHTGGFRAEDLARQARRVERQALRSPERLDRVVPVSANVRHLPEPELADVFDFPDRSERATSERW